MKKIRILLIVLAFALIHSASIAATVEPIDPDPCDPADPACPEYCDPSDPGCEEFCEETDPSCCDPADPVCPLYCEPTDPTCCDPADPVCPNYCDPTDPSCCDPSDPECPNYCDPSDPACSDPVDPIDPTDPADPTDPTDPTDPQTDDCDQCATDLDEYNSLITDISDPSISIDDRDIKLHEFYELRNEIQTCLESLPDSCQGEIEAQVEHPSTNQNDFVRYNSDTVPVYVTDHLFPDVLPEDLYAKSIYFLVNLNVINGYPDGSYKPAQSVNRVEALKILFAAVSQIRPDYYIDTESTSLDLGFPDTEQNQWYVPYVFVAKSAGIVQGYPDGSFKPGNTVNKVEYLKMAFEAFGIDVNQINLDDAPYSDLKAGEWYMPYINLAYHLNLFDQEAGEAINPGADMTRQEVADVTYRLLKTADSRFLNHDPDSASMGESLDYGSGVFINPYLESKGCKPIGEIQEVHRVTEDEFIKEITIHYKDGSNSKIDGNKTIQYSYGGSGKLGSSWSEYVRKEIDKQVSADGKDNSKIDKIVFTIEVTKTTTDRTIECQESGDTSKWVEKSKTSSKTTREVEKTINYADLSSTDHETIEIEIENIKEDVTADTVLKKTRKPKSECSPAGAKDTKTTGPEVFRYVTDLKVYLGDSLVHFESNQDIWNHDEGATFDPGKLSNSSPSLITNHLEWYIKTIYPKNKTIKDVTKIIATFLKIERYTDQERVCVQKTLVQDGETLTWNQWEEGSSSYRSDRTTYTSEWVPWEDDTAKDIAEDLQRAMDEK